MVALSAQPVFLDAEESVWSRLTVRPLVRVIFRNVYADLEKMEARLTRSESDWTILRPPYLTDKPGTGSYRAAVDANVPGSIARADLARAMLDVLDDASTIKHAVGVAGPRK